jgi:hypothetical protein
MQIIQKFYSPDAGDDELSGANPKNKTEKKDNLPDAHESIANDSKPIKTSIQDALQQWSNDDARDREEDDSTPLRSGL